MTRRHNDCGISKHVAARDAGVRSARTAMYGAAVHARSAGVVGLPLALVRQTKAWPLKCFLSLFVPGRSDTYFLACTFIGYRCTLHQ